MIQLGLGVLPITVCLGTWLLVAAHTREWRWGLLLATIVVGVGIATTTEAMSLVGGLTATWVTAAWLTALVALGVTWGRWGRPSPPVRRLRGLVDVWIGFGVIIAALLLVLALAGAPNNWDSMTYHMTRVVHWVAAGDVGYYPTHIERQLFSQTWAEFAILHLQLLTGSDHLANLVQWAAMVVTVVATTTIAVNLGVRRAGQIAAAVVVLTLPVGLTQAPTTQNDYVAAMWVAILAALVTRRPTSWQLTLAIGLAAGLGAMTKATTYFFIAPLLLWWLVDRLRRGRTAVPRDIGIIALPALALASPGMVRNIAVFGSPWGPPLPFLVNDPIGVRATAENLLRHAAAQLGTPSAGANDAAERPHAKAAWSEVPAA